MPQRLALLAVLAFVLLVQGGCRVRSYGGADPHQAAPAGLDYPVRPGDTLSSIADAHGIPVRAIIDANDLSSSRLAAGQVLRLPGVTETPKLPVAVAKPDWFIPRTKWAVQPMVTSRLTPMGVKPNRMTVHHTSEMSLPSGLSERGDAVEVLRYIEDIHIKGLGKNEPFACIGYHFLVASNGLVFEGRPLAWQGAHARGDNNIGNIGICLLGDFDRYRPTPQQVQGLIALLDRLHAEYGIEVTPRTVLCHKDFVATNCPGSHLEPIVRAYSEGRWQR